MTKATLLGIALLFMGCNKNTFDNEDAPAFSMMELSEPVACMAPPPMDETVKFIPPKIDEDETSLSGGVKKSKQKIIRNADITIQEDDILAAKNALDKLVKLCNGYYSADNFSKSTEHSSVGLGIRIPVENFDKFMNNMDGLKLNVTRKLISSEDVTEEYYDIQSRLANQRKLEQRYLELLTKAQKVSDMLEIEEHIGTVRGEVESAEGKIKYMDDRVAYSTINIAIRTVEKEAAILMPAFTERIRLALQTGWDGLGDLTISVVRNWPLYIVIIFFVFFIRRFWKKRKKLKV